MNAWIDPRWSVAINHALLHSVWQSAAVAAVLWSLLQVLQSSARRYAAAMTALILVAVLFVGTLWGALPPRLTPTIVRVADWPRQISPIVSSLAPASTSGRTFTDWIRATAPTVWLIGITVLALFHLIGWLRLRAWQREANTLGDSASLDRWQTLAQHIGVRRKIIVGESRRVTAPAVIGLWRPMILLPIGMLTNTDPRLLDALVAHELAHIRRHDTWLNLLQIALETTLFYHPAVWWISRQIRAERECCCDAVAARVGGDGKTVAEALTHLAAHFVAPPLLLTAHRGPLLQRVQRLLDPSPRRTTRSWLTAFTPLAIISIILLGRPMRLPQALAEPSATHPSTNASNVGRADAQLQLNELRADLEERRRVMELLVSTMKPDDPAVLQAKKVYVAAQLRYEAAVRPFQQPATTQRVDPEEMATIANLAAGFAEAQLRHLEAEQKFGAASPQVREARLAEEDARHLYRRARESSATDTHQQTLFYMSGVKEPGAYSWTDRPITLPEALLFGGMWAAADPTIFIYRQTIVPPTTEMSGGRIRVSSPPIKDTEPMKFTAAEALGDKGKAFIVQSNDTIVVSDSPDAPKPLANDYSVFGDVPRPGVYELGGTIDLLQALIAAGIDPVRQAGGRVTLHHVHAPADQISSYLIDSLLSGLHVAVQSGDAIQVHLAIAPAN